MPTRKPNPIASARQTKGLTQSELAKRIKATRSSVANWETDVCPPPPAAALRLRKELGLSLDRIYSRAGD